MQEGSNEEAEGRGESQEREEGAESEKELEDGRMGDC